MNLSHKIVGKGGEKIVLLHDWFSSAEASYELFIKYLDLSKFTLALIDLRGYGNSIDITGNFSAKEVIEDILEITDKLGWHEFSLIGHSMTGLVAQVFAITHPEKLNKVIAVCPVPIIGNMADEGSLEFMKSACLNGGVNATGAVNTMSGLRMSEYIVEQKKQNWYASSTAEARIGYLNMFAATDYSAIVKKSKVDITFLSGEFDIMPYKKEALENSLKDIFTNSAFEEIKNAAHYPMHEVPMYFATLLEKILS